MLENWIKNSLRQVGEYERAMLELETVSNYSVSELKELFAAGHTLSPPNTCGTSEMSLYVIASHYGYEHQSRQCIEEMAELTQAINKHWRKEIPNRNNHQLLCNIYEEIADVEVCLDQLKLLLNCHAEVDAMKQYKIDREIQRITESLERGPEQDE